MKTENKVLLLKKEEVLKDLSEFFEDLEINELFSLWGELIKVLRKKMPITHIKRRRIKNFRTLWSLPSIANQTIAKYKYYIHLGLMKQTEKPSQGEFLTYSLIAAIILWEKQLEKKQLLQLPPTMPFEQILENYTNDVVKKFEPK